MPRTASAGPTDTLPATIHHLALLVNAVTSQLSACLSLDSLLRQTARHIKSSPDLLARAEAYYNSLQISRKSLETFNENVAVEFRLLPQTVKDINDSSLRRMNVLESQLCCASWRRSRVNGIERVMVR